MGEMGVFPAAGGVVDEEAEGGVAAAVSTETDDGCAVGPEKCL